MRALIAHMALALVSSACFGQSNPQQDFEDGKALGLAKTGPAAAAIRDGSATSTVPSYTDNPPEKTYWSTKNFSSPLAAQQAHCAATPTDPMCAGIQTGSQPRPAYPVSRSDPALAGDDVATNPTLILGDIATTYSACTTSTPTLVSPAMFEQRTCSLVNSAWHRQTCQKTLTVVPQTKTSCPQSTWFARASGGLVTTKGIDVQAWCNVAPPTPGMWLFEIGETPDYGARQTAAVHFQMEAATPSAPGQSPPKLASFGGAPSFFNTGGVDVYAEGPGCNAQGNCVARFHYFASTLRCWRLGIDVECHGAPMGALDAKFTCPAGQRPGNELYFVTGQGGMGGMQATARGDGHACFAPGESGQLAAPFEDIATYGTWVQVGASTATPGLLTIPGGGHTVLTLTMQRPKLLAAASETWANGCDALEKRTTPLPPDGENGMNRVVADPNKGTDSQCVRSQSTCLDGPSTKVIDGEEVTRACWLWTNTFDCANATASSSCLSDMTGCSPAHGTPGECTHLDAQGRCLAQTLSYDCKTADAVYGPVLNCGDSSFCSGGSCWETSYEPNDQFAYAVSHMEARSEAGQDFNSETYRVFAGNYRYCDIDAYGMRDCCNESSDLISCTQTQKDTVTMKRAGLCHEVGTFCDNKDPFGGCISTRHSHCCYRSLLARVVQEQAHLQTGWSWGTPQAPICEGMTVEQFQNLDWAAMDLSEFYASINPTLPDNAGSTTHVDGQKDNCYYGDGKCSP